jgi:protein TonB
MKESIEAAQAVVNKHMAESQAAVEKAVASQSTDAPSVLAAPRETAAGQRVTVSPDASHDLLISQVPPVYPPLARQTRIQGTVVLRALISRTGEIKDLAVISGHPMLVPAAMDAVKQWRYRPYSVKGQPVEVMTTINVNFTLANGGAGPQ